MTSLIKKIIFNFILVITILSVTFILLLLIEIGSMVLLKIRNNQDLPFLIMEQSKKEGIPRAQGWDTDGSISYYDPLLAFAHHPKTFSELEEDFSGGFVKYEFNKNAKKSLTIVVLGGSTTDPMYGANWGEELALLFKQDGFHITVYNGGVAGYSSSQEMLKLLRDGIFLNPDYIIGLHGVNDLGFIHSLSYAPIHHKYHKQIGDFLLSNEESNSPFMPNTVKVLKKVFNLDSQNQHYTQGINFGVNRKENSWDTWEKNIRIMNSTCEEFGIEYISLLQPIMGYGKSVFSDDEKEMYKFAEKRFNGTYLSDVKSFYSHAVKISDQYDFSYDITGIFENQIDVYRDARHQTEKGIKIIAEEA